MIAINYYIYSKILYVACCLKADHQRDNENFELLVYIYPMDFPVIMKDGRLFRRNRVNPEYYSRCRN